MKHTPNQKLIAFSSAQSTPRATVDSRSTISQARISVALFVPAPVLASLPWSAHAPKNPSISKRAGRVESRF